MDPSNLDLPTPGFILTNQVKFRLDRSQLIEGLSQTLADIVFKSWADGGASAIVSLTKSFLSFNVDNKPGNKAYNLIALAFGWSIGQVINQYSVEHDFVKRCLHRGLDEAQDSIADDVDVIGPDFLYNPTTSLFYTNLKDKTVFHLMTVLQPLGFSDDVLKSKIDIAFVRALYEVWSSSPANYIEISNTLPSPLNDISELVLSWQSYRYNLLEHFEVTPVFGQEQDGISLSQLYIPLRGFWEKKSDAEDRFASNHPGGSDTEVVMIERHIDDWLSGSDENNWLKLIGGGPGSGKSTTLKSIAARYAKMDQWRPLFIPLQHIGIEGDLRQRINSYFSERTGSPFKKGPLSRQSVEFGSKFLLIFDGLDEISAPNESASDVVHTFTAKLTSLYSALAGNGDISVRVIVSGRLPAFQEAKRFLPVKPDSAIEAFGYSPVIRSSDDELWTIDQRPDWWKKYATAKNLDPTIIPEALSDEGLSGISHEPLLCYLLALSNYTGSNWKEAADNPNLIYRALMNSVYERGWGDGPQKRLGAGKSMTAEQFDKLMQTFGLAAWLGGDSRVASESNFKAVLNVTRGQDAWSTFERDNGPDMNNLAMNFYLKSSEQVHRGFEFTHKSFGEYLASKALIDYAFYIHDLVDRSLDAAMQEWFKATREGVFRNELLRFMRNEMRLMPASDLDKMIGLKSSFQRLAKMMITEGYVTASYPDYRKLEISQNNAEMCIWAILHSVTLRINEVSESIEYIQIDWSSRYDAAQLMMRRVTADPFSSSPADCLAYLDARQQSFINVAAYGVDFYMANLEGANFESSNLTDSSFVNTNLEGVGFYSTLLSSASFHNARMEGVHFHECYLEDVLLEHAQTSNIKMDLRTLSTLDKIEESIPTAISLSKVRSVSGRLISKDELLERLDKRFNVLRQLIEERLDTNEVEEDEE